MKNIKGIKKAAGEATQALKTGLSVIISYDTQKNEVWADIHASTNNWLEYHNPNIISVAQYNGLFKQKVTQAEIRENITLALNERR